MFCCFFLFQGRNKSKTEAWAERFTCEFWRRISGRAVSQGPRPYCVQEGKGVKAVDTPAFYTYTWIFFYLMISSRTRNQNSYCAQLCGYMLTLMCGLSYWWTRDVWTFILMNTCLCFFCVSIMLQLSLLLLLFQEMKSQSFQNWYFESYTI